MARAASTVTDLPQLRNHIRVFRDRTHAAEVLVEMLNAYDHTDTLALGIPAGGVPVAAVLAQKLGLTLDVAVVSKITLPWNPEAGYGAVAFDGTVRLNEQLVKDIALAESEIEHGIARTRQKVAQRLRRLRGDRPFPDTTNRQVMLVDDGLASGFTMLVAMEAMRKSGAGQIIVAVPTAHAESVSRIVAEADALYCPNIREGLSYAVADAYERWSDVAEETAAELLKTYRDGQST